MKMVLEDQDSIELYPAFLQSNGNSVQTYVAMKIKTKKNPTLITR